MVHPFRGATFQLLITASAPLAPLALNLNRILTGRAPGGAVEENGLRLSS